MIYDVCIVGCGVAGTMAAYKISKDHKNLACLVIEGGRPAGKRRLQMSGFFGLLPNSDGKLYLNDADNIETIAKHKNTANAQKWLDVNTKNIINEKIIKDIKPFKTTQNKIKNNGFKLHLNNYTQYKPRHIHSLAKYISDTINSNSNLNAIFDTEILDISKDKKNFIVQCEENSYICKKVILCSGRSGWRWTTKLFENFGLTMDNNVAKFGIRIEMPNAFMQDFNGSNCTIFNDDLEIGPLCWDGTVIPEDHVDMVISAFRSNEDRWKSDNVSFNLFCKKEFKNEAVDQISRIGQLTWILSNDRVIKEKISLILAKKSKISIMPEYDWLPEVLSTISKIIPDLIDSGSFHVPTVLPMTPKVKLTKYFETRLNDLYCAGEAAGYQGLLFAMLSGIIAAEGVAREFA